MADQHGADEAFSTDMQLIEELAAGLRMSRWPGDSDTIVELGDLEDTSILAVRNGVFTYETTSRGERSIQAAFSSARDARRCLVMELCDSYRFANRMPPLVMKQLAAGSELEDGPTGHRLTWPGGEATFYRQSSAVTFSWAIGAGPDTILASYQHVNGEPLFDLGIPVDEWNLHTAARRPPGGPVMEPRIEPPLPTTRTRPTGRPSTPFSPTSAGNAARRPAPTCSPSAMRGWAGPSPIASPSSSTSRRTLRATARQGARSPPPPRPGGSW
jgi:hypothetical protein